VEEKMRITLTGASGLIGRHLIKALTEDNHEISLLTRSPQKNLRRSFFWDPSAGILPAEALNDAEVVIHLAGENISSGRWSSERKDLLIQSRIESTRLLVSRLTSTSHRPRLFLSASATGFYGNRSDQILDESSCPGTGFLAELCQKWEQESRRGEETGIRSIQMRFGMVLDPIGGALAKMLPIFRFGLGGRLGGGKQYWRWITSTDLVRAIQFLIQSTLTGPVNLVAPLPVTNGEFTTQLAKVLKRPALFPAPPFALRMALGEMADELLLASARVTPAQLTRNGFTFNHPELTEALSVLLRKKN